MGAGGGGGDVERAASGAKGGGEDEVEEVTVAASRERDASHACCCSSRCSGMGADEMGPRRLSRPTSVSRENGLAGTEAAFRGMSSVRTRSSMPARTSRWRVPSGRLSAAEDA